MLADDDFGGASANVDDQAFLLAGRQRTGHAAIDQPGFLLAGNDFDGKAQQLASTRHEFVGIQCLAQGLGGYSADMRGIKAPEALAKASQALPAALHGFAGEFLARVQAIALAHGFLEVFHTLDALMRADAAYFKAKAIGTKVYGGKQRFRSHF